MVTKVALHHSGPPAGFNYTFEDIDAYHKQRWNMRSSLGRYGGYNLAINPKGQHHQFRAIGEETMAQKGHNLDTVSICLIGDFLKDIPTWEQSYKLKNVLYALLDNKPERLNLKVLKDTEIKISPKNIAPHRTYDKRTLCYGTRLKDNWGRELVSDRFPKGHFELLISLLKSWRLLVVQLERLGSNPSSKCIYD